MLERRKLTFIDGLSGQASFCVLLLYIISLFFEIDIVI